MLQQGPWRPVEWLAATRAGRRALSHPAAAAASSRQRERRTVLPRAARGGLCQGGPRGSTLRRPTPAAARCFPAGPCSRWSRPGAGPLARPGSTIWMRCASRRPSASMWVPALGAAAACAAEGGVGRSAAWCGAGQCTCGRMCGGPRALRGRASCCPAAAPGQCRLQQMMCNRPSVLCCAALCRRLARAARTRASWRSTG